MGHLEKSCFPAGFSSPRKDALSRRVTHLLNNSKDKPFRQQVQLPIQLVDLAHLGLFAQAVERGVGGASLIGPAAEFDLGRQSA